MPGTTAAPSILIVDGATCFGLNTKHQAPAEVYKREREREKKNLQITFDVLLTVHISTMSVINQLNTQNLVL